MVNLSNLTDEDLIKHICTQDKEAFLEIVSRYQDKLLRYADVFTKNRSRSEDVVQDSFIKAFINLRGFDTGKKFSSWMYRIVHNEAINEAVKNKKELPILDGVDFPSDEDIEKELITKETVERTKNCLAQMPIEYAELLMLFYMEDKSYEDISNILRTPVSTIGTRIRRAKILLKKICQKIKK